MKHYLSALLALIISIAAYGYDRSGFTTYWEQRATLFDVLPVDSTDIIMIGNSITDGGEWGEQFGTLHVKNRGISGDIVKGVTARLEPYIEGKPAKMFLMIGINDIMRGADADSVYGLYVKLIDKIRTEMPDTRLYVQSCLPINIVYGLFTALEGKDGEVAKLNRMISGLADEKGFTWIDLHSAPADENGKLPRKYSNDGLHLLGEGYLKWTQTIMPYILE